MKALHTLWNFSRPHTILGSVISIFTLFIILCENNRAAHVPLLLLAIIAGIACNIYIVGINQIADVDIDRINKPWLPIPSGALNLKQARLIVYAALVISLALSLYMTFYFFVIILLSALIGWAYSMPPFFLKQHHLPAAIAISMVRGILVNAGGFIVFNRLVSHHGPMPENLLMLTLFITVFAIVIAWFKDLPDVKGDNYYNIKTFAILYSPATAFITGHLLVAAVYVFTIYRMSGSYAENASGKASILFFGHIFLLVLFMLNSLSVKLNFHASVRNFYKRFWLFFFAEYLLYFIAYI